MNFRSLYREAIWEKMSTSHSLEDLAIAKVGYKLGHLACWLVANATFILLAAYSLHKHLLSWFGFVELVLFVTYSFLICPLSEELFLRRQIAIDVERIQNGRKPLFNNLWINIQVTRKLKEYDPGDPHCTIEIVEYLAKTVKAEYDSATSAIDSATKRATEGLTKLTSMERDYTAQVWLSPVSTNYLAVVKNHIASLQVHLERLHEQRQRAIAHYSEVELACELLRKENSVAMEIHDIASANELAASLSLETNLIEQQIVRFALQSQQVVETLKSISVETRSRSASEIEIAHYELPLIQRLGQ